MGRGHIMLYSRGQQLSGAVGTAEGIGSTKHWNMHCRVKKVPLAAMGHCCQLGCSASDSARYISL